MKSLTANILHCHCKLYKIGLIIGIIYLIPNLLIVVSVFRNGFDDYMLPLLCALTVLTSLLLIQGLMEERHELLIPWLANIVVLIIFNIILVSVQIGEIDRVDSKQAFYLELAFFIGLEIQVLFWYIIYYLLKYGYRKHKRLSGSISIISKIVEFQGKDHYKVNLMDHGDLGTRKEVLSV